MSVIVKGMQMPYRCEYCGFCQLHTNTGWVWCNAEYKILYDKCKDPYFSEWETLQIEKPDWCPLRPLPEKHGMLNAIPAADVRPVVRGKWIEWWPGDCTLIMTGEEMLWMCSECTEKFSDKSSLCHFCGADMR